MLIIFFLIGLIFGSFLNVLVYRLYVAESFLFSRSHCPNCKSEILWYDNIPVISFVLLHFRCRNCKKKISWQYPIVEILTGIVFALVGWKFFHLEDMQTWLLTGYYLFISSALIVILVYDFLHMEIPSGVLWIGCFLALAFGLYMDWELSFLKGNVNLFETMVYPGILSAFLSFLFFFSLSYFSREKWMGMGDAYLVIFLGIVLGWPEIILALFLSFFFGAIYGIIVLALKKKKMKSQVPFAPFLVAGSFVSLFFYSQIIEVYFSGFFGF